MSLTSKYFRYVICTIIAVHFAILILLWAWMVAIPIMINPAMLDVVVAFKAFGRIFIDTPLLIVYSIPIGAALGIYFCRCSMARRENNSERERKRSEMARKYGG